MAASVAAAIGALIQPATSELPVIPEIDSAESKRRAVAKLFLGHLRRNSRPGLGYSNCEVISEDFYWHKHPSENEWLRGIAKRFEECGHTTYYKDLPTYWESPQSDHISYGKKWHMCVSWGSTGAGDKIDV
jgi:hypothetical protein